MATVVTFNLDNVLPLVVLTGEVTNQMLVNHIETCAPGVYQLDIDSEGIWSELLSGGIEPVRHYNIQSCLVA